MVSFNSYSHAGRYPPLNICWAVSAGENAVFLQAGLCTRLGVRTGSSREGAWAVLPLPAKVHLEELHKLWDLLLELTQEKGALLLRALKLQQYLQECADILEWIGDKVGDPQATSSTSPPRPRHPQPSNAGCWESGQGVCSWTLFLERSNFGKDLGASWR